MEGKRVYMSQFSTTAALEVCIGEEEVQGGESEGGRRRVERGRE